jgi:SsrA-binding protein
MAKSAPGAKTLITNRKARHLYEILDTMEAGLELAGTEVKSLREGKGSLTDAYAVGRGDELWLQGLHIPPYEHGNRYNKEPDRLRKLLLHRREINRLLGTVATKGLTIVPLRVYLNDRGWVKVELALCRGKKVYDKRRDIRDRDLRREAEREMKHDR